MFPDPCVLIPLLGFSGLDCSRGAVSAARLEQWETGALDPEAVRDRFVTGDWAKGKQRSELQPKDGDDDDDEVYGDFEDMETGANLAGGSGDTVKDAAMKAIQASVLRSPFLHPFNRALPPSCLASVSIPSVSRSCLWIKGRILGAAKCLHVLLCLPRLHCFVLP